MPDTTERVPAWQQRFRAPILAFPSWAADDPDRLVMSSTESGSYQLHAWDRRTGRRRRVTFDPVGVLDGRPTADGGGVVWFRDETGAETGSWVVSAFDEDIAPEPLVEGVPVAWSSGLALGRTRTVVALNGDDGFGIWVADGSAPARQVLASDEALSLAGAGISGVGESGALSADESIVCFALTVDGDVLHPALVAIDAATGEELGRIHDPGRALEASGFSPVPGDRRMAITHERTGEERPATWDVATGEVTTLALDDLVGPVHPVDWWPDGSALLLLQLVEGRHRLHRYELATGVRTALDTEPGSITGAVVRPDGEVWYRVQRGEYPARLLRVGSAEPLLEPEGPRAPAGHAFESWWFEKADGTRVHGFVATPEGDGPHPVILRVHGGPHWADTDRWAPDLLAHVDAGFLVAMVNYRGSLGYGPEWRDALTGNIGFHEIEDVLAGLDDLVARGLVDPSRVVLAGWSWGGYVTLLGIGRHPDRFVSAIAGVPVADYVAAYEDEAPMLQALDRALFGGSPDEVPDLYRERSPLTYVDDVRVPLLIMAGENDSRCPIRQVRNYVAALDARGASPETYFYSTGHASFDVDERIRQAALTLDFLARTVPGVRQLDGVEDWLPVRA